MAIDGEVRGEEKLLMHRRKNMKDIQETGNRRGREMEEKTKRKRAKRSSSGRTTVTTAAVATTTS